MHSIVCSVCGIFDFIVGVKPGANAPDYPDAGDLGYYNTPSPLYDTFGGKMGAILSATLNVWCEVHVVIVTWRVHTGDSAWVSLTTRTQAVRTCTQVGRPSSV